MSRKLVIAVSGKRGSGKNTFVNQVVARYLNEHDGDRYTVTKFGVCEPDIPDEVLNQYGVAYTAFADPLKRFCIQVMGLSPSQCYGTDDDKNTLTKVKWDALPQSIRGDRTGYMTAREVMKVFGTDVVRAWVANGWVDACHRHIQALDVKLVVISDVRFPNEANMFVDYRQDEQSSDIVKLVRLSRSPYHDTHESEIALDDYPTDRYDLVVPDCDGVDSQWECISPYVEQWLAEAGLISLGVGE